MKQEDIVSADSAVSNRAGFFISVLTAGLTLLTFGIAVFTPPLSGPFCMEGCFQYPYTDIASRFPRDYIWMYPALVLMVVYMVFIVCIHHYARKEKRLYSQLGVIFASMSVLTLVIDYFVQLAVVQPSIVARETDGIALLTQYNPHGLFIVLEEIGYLFMSLSFLFVAFVFSGKNGLEKAIYFTFLTGFILSVVSLAVISYLYGILREYRFEIAIIFIDWVVLILASFLLSRLFSRNMKLSAQL